MDGVNQEGTSLNEHSAADLLAGMIDETGLIKQPENDHDEQQEESTETEEGSEQAEERQEAGDGQSEQSEQPHTVTLIRMLPKLSIPIAPRTQAVILRFRSFQRNSQSTVSSAIPAKNSRNTRFARTGCSFALPKKREIRT